MARAIIMEANQFFILTTNIGKKSESRGNTQEKRTNWASFADERSVGVVTFEGWLSAIGKSQVGRD
jgi:hypothetical protein